MTHAIFFYVFSSVMLLAAAIVILNRRPIYSVLALLVVMFCLAALFVMLGAYFLAAVQVLLYAGAVLVLFLFVMMLLNLQPEERAHRRGIALRRFAVFALVGLLVQQLLKAFLSPKDNRALDTVPAVDTSVESIARLLFTDYLLPFELASFLILAAIIGAVTLSRQHDRS